MESLRRKIDSLNLKILQLFEARLYLVRYIIKIKQKRGISVLDRARELDILKMVMHNSCKELGGYVWLLFRSILNISKLMQYEMIGSNFIHKLKKNIKISGLKVGGVSRFVLVKGTNLYRVLACGRHVYVCGLLKFKNGVYYCLSCNIYFERGFNIVLIKLKFENINELYLYLFGVLTLKKVRILKFNILEKNAKFIELFVYCLGYFKSLRCFSNFVKCLTHEGFKLTVYGCFKIKKAV